MFKSRVFSAILSAFLLAVAMPVVAQDDVEGSQDHPLLGRYEGFGIATYRSVEYDAARVISGPLDDDYAVTTEVVEGSVTNILYQSDAADFSALQIFRSYEAALAKLDAELMFSCFGDEACVENADTWSNAIVENSALFRGTQPYLRDAFGILSARVIQGDQTAHITIALAVSDDGGGGEIAQSITTEIPLGAGKIDVGALAGAALPVGATSASREDMEGAKDHPLLSRYPGFYISDYNTTEYDTADVVTGPLDDAYAVVTTSTEGAVTNILYKAETPNTSALQIFRSYETAVANLGGETLFSCLGTEACGENASTWSNAIADSPGLFRGAQPYLRDAFGILTAKLGQNGGPTYITIAFAVSDDGGSAEIAQSIITAAPLDTDKVGIGSIEELTASINDTGTVVLEGVLFETDSATLTPASKEVLDVVTGYLETETDRPFLVVGHTDNQGAYGYNLDLSQKRADAVKAALSDRGIDPARLNAVGVGMAAPVANNDTAEGQTLNRRVVLVAQE